MKSRRDIKIIHLDESQLHRLLRSFEDQYLEASGEHLDSTAFYERYTAGEFDHPYGMIWATYFEALQRRRETDDPDVRAIGEAVTSFAVPVG